MPDNTMYFIKINDTVLPVPFYYAVTSQDITSADSGRYDETGTVHRNRIRRSVKTCEVKWRIPGSQLEALDVKLSGELLAVSLLDPASAGYTDCEMYADSVDARFYQQQNASEEQSWWEISVKLIEF